MVWFAGLVILSCCCGWLVVYLFSARSELLGLGGGFWLAVALLDYGR